MIKIKFSHKYDKMPPGFQHSKLLDVLPVNLEVLSLDFILYDTSYTEGGEGKNYPLPAKGAYMVLLLLTQSGCLWTTIRSQRGSGGRDKLAYYRGLIGQWVECEVNG